MNRRSGFTLVEMLVAVGLVVLMMSLFAQIFTMATGAMATQKGIAENDQRARLVATLLRKDLENRTARIVQPFDAGETTVSDENIGLRDGYLYIGENDRNDGTDDVLQLTVKASTDDLFYGRSVLLAGDISSTPNQPEFDDGFATVNNAGSSQYAEVSYFLRNGTLYRRVLLIRQPIKEDLTNAGDGTPRAGTQGNGTPIDLQDYTSAATTPKNFLTDFDYSSFATGSGATFTGPRFHGVADLSNANDGATNVFRLGNPRYRFGHDHGSGLPREFIGNNFIGRFTHWETSFQPSGSYVPMAGNAQYFGYPGRVDSPISPNPMASSLVYNQTYGLVSNYSLRDASGRPVPGPRASEDILMTRVVRFDIKIWDDKADVGPDGVAGAAVANAGPDGVNGTSDDVPANGTLGWPGSDDGAFVDVGHAGTGDYSESVPDPMYLTSANDRYMRPHPANSSERLWRFDTWNPNVSLIPPATPDPPPFRAPISLSDSTKRMPLRAIQITLTFYDLTSQQLRDTTLRISLTD